MNLKELKIGEVAVINSIGGKAELRQHFLDMGLVPGTTIKLVKYAPMGDPAQYRIHGYELTLRLNDAANINITKTSEEIEKDFGDSIDHTSNTPHPGFGEGGKYHVKASENPLPDGTALTFALVGNQNCGKTTLFNQLTGSNQHVGNFPGVTVDKKSGPIRGFNNTDVTDLPGIYSMSPYTPEEIVSREFILKNKPTGIINIVDASNIERNLFLTMQLMELDIPMVLALNMMDEVRNNGGHIHVNEMEEALGIPVVPISASKNEGVDELISHAMHIAKYQEKPGRADFCDVNDHDGAVHRCIHGIMHLIFDHAEKANIPVRFAATKIIEGDHLIMESLNLSANEKEMIEHIIMQMEEERGLDRAAAIADMRFEFITKLCKKCVGKPKESKEHLRSTKIDKILTGKYTAIPCFVAIMASVFYLTFNLIGKFFQNALATIIQNLSDKIDILFTQLDVNSAIHSLVIDGIFSGVGSVVSFLPIVVTLFLFLALLEDTGYIARVAFFMDKILRKIGLSGRSIVPMLIGFGCTVPAVMATRILPSERDRKMTIFLTPFMSCSAKLPIYGFFIAAFFSNHAWLVMVSLYFLSIIVGILFAFILKHTYFKGEPVPFVMELPNYRLPSFKNVIQLLWEKAKDFLEKAFSVVFIGTIIIWILETFDTSFSMTSDSSKSILALIAGLFVPILKPLGLGDWKIAVSLISGFMAKESVVSTMNILFGGKTAIKAFLSPISAASMLVFCLLYTPCIAAINSVKKELGIKSALSMMLISCLIAWIMAFITKVLLGVIL